MHGDAWRCMQGDACTHLAHPLGRNRGDDLEEPADEGRHVVEDSGGGHAWEAVQEDREGNALETLVELGHLHAGEVTHNRGFVRPIRLEEAGRLLETRHQLSEGHGRGRSLRRCVGRSREMHAPARARR